MSTFQFPFPISEDPNKCNTDPCVSSNDCFVCGYDSTVCVGSGNCSQFFIDNNVNTKFLNGNINGFSGKLGFGGSESSVNIDLVVFKDSECDTSLVSASPCPTCPPGTNTTYDGRLGYIYTFSMGNFCFRGILSNHTYSEDSSGYKYRLTLSDGKVILSGISIILNSIYDRPPSKLEHNVLNALYFLEPSVDDCDGEFKCNDFMKSGANPKGIFLKRAIDELNGKQIKVPISEICLTLKLDRLSNIIPSTYRTTTNEMPLLDLISLSCEEVGHSFFVQITQDNELEIIPIDYTKPIVGNPLLSFIDNMSQSDNVTSKEYGQEMTFEKNKRIVFGDFYHYLTTVSEPEISIEPACEVNPPNPDDCLIENAPRTKLVTRSSDEPLEANNSPEPSCS